MASLVPVLRHRNMKSALFRMAFDVTRDNNKRYSCRLPKFD